MNLFRCGIKYPGFLKNIRRGSGIPFIRIQIHTDPNPLVFQLPVFCFFILYASHHTIPPDEKEI